VSICERIRTRMDAKARYYVDTMLFRLRESSRDVCAKKRVVLQILNFFKEIFLAKKRDDLQLRHSGDIVVQILKTRNSVTVNNLHETLAFPSKRKWTFA